MDTLDLSIARQPVIVKTDYESLDKAQMDLQAALKRVNSELDYLENQPDDS